jgi:hypothetical protein
MSKTRSRVLVGLAALIALTALVGGAYLFLKRDGLAQALHTATPVAKAAEAGVALTVYNEGTALVKDLRRFEFEGGLNTISFVDVAASIDPTSVHFNSLSDPEGTVVLEQNYVYDLVGTSALLDKYLDETIQVVTEDGTSFRGQLLSGRGDIILEGDNGEVQVVRADNIREYNFPELPEGLITRPTLVWQVRAAQSGEQDVEVTYLTGGLSWQADYTVLLAQDDSSIDLDGWVTLNNTSGATYEDAQLKLVAGDLQRLAAERAAVGADMIEFAAEAEAPAVAEREFFEYHLYEVERSVTVRDNETKQIEFVRGTGVPAERFFLYDGAFGPRGYFPYFYGYPVTDTSYGVGTDVKVAVMLEFNTGEDDGLGADLPRGRVRVYQEDVDGAALLVGEDQIDHTPEGETVQLYVGDAFDIAGERVQTDFTRPSDHSLEEAYEITLRNRKDEETVEVRVVEHLFRWTDWEILSSSTDYVKLDSSTIEFRVSLEPDEEQTVGYKVRYTWP